MGLDIIHRCWKEHVREGLYSIDGNWGKILKLLFHRGGG